MSFLMGLNDSFAQIKAQLLLLDPPSPINKVFSLVSQKERQRFVSSSIGSRGIDTTHDLAFAVKAHGNKRTDPPFSTNPKTQRKERPFCTHYNYLGHTIEKCYKLHGYPPGYKLKQRSLNGPINHISTKVALDEQYNDSATLGLLSKLLTQINTSNS